MKSQGENVEKYLKNILEYAILIFVYKENAGQDRSTMEECIPWIRVRCGKMYILEGVLLGFF